MHRVRRVALAASLLLLTGVSAGCTAEAREAADKPVSVGSAATPRSLDPKLLAMVDSVSMAGRQVNRTVADAAQRNGNQFQGAAQVNKPYMLFAVCAGKGAVIAKLHDGKKPGVEFEVPCRTDKAIGETREIVAATTNLWTESTPRPGTTGVVVLQVVAA